MPLCAQPARAHMVEERGEKSLAAFPREWEFLHAHASALKALRKVDALVGIEMHGRREAISERFDLALYVFKVDLPARLTGPRNEMVNDDEPADIPDNC